MLARAGAARAEGFDVNLEVVEHARERAGDVAEFAVGDLSRIPHPDATFDLVTCFEAIEHVEDPFRALDELRRVMAPGRESYSCRRRTAGCTTRTTRTTCTS